MIYSLFYILCFNSLIILYQSVSAIFSILFTASLVCPTGYVERNEQCYGFPRQSLTWPQARTHCNGISTGYDLVVIKDGGENSFLREEIRNRGRRDQFWIGLKKSDTNNAYNWVDASGLEVSRNPSSPGFGKQSGQNPWSNNEPNSVNKIIPINTL